MPLTLASFASRSPLSARLGLGLYGIISELATPLVTAHAIYRSGAVTSGVASSEMMP